MQVQLLSKESYSSKDGKKTYYNFQVMGVGKNEDDVNVVKLSFVDEKIWENAVKLDEFIVEFAIKPFGDFASPGIRVSKITPTEE